MNRLWRIVPILVTGCAALVTGCAAGGADRATVSAMLAERTGQGIAPRAPLEPSTPPGMLLDDGVSEEEAVALALWSNPGFQEALAELGIERAHLIQAGLLPNPVLSVLFPVGPKQLEFAAQLPLEALWLRPRRVRAAELDLERAAARLVQYGLDLAREVKEAYAALELARDRRALAEESARLAEEKAAFELRTFQAGETSEAQALEARAEASRRRGEAELLALETAASEERLRGLLGPVASGGPAPALRFRRGSAEDAAGPAPGADLLLRQALASRPDLRAAELGVEAAAERAGLARWEALAISAIIDANGEGRDGFEMGPGLQMELPLFHLQPGRRALAQAQLERAALGYAALRQSIAAEVREGGVRLEEARAALRLWEVEVVPVLEEALRRNESRHRAGEVALLPVLESRERLLEARRQAAEARALLRRARARLERGLGGRLGAVPRGGEAA